MLSVHSGAGRSQQMFDGGTQAGTELASAVDTSRFIRTEYSSSEICGPQGF